MARVTVEDCIDKVDSPYELVLVSKERATQLNSGIEPSIERDNDKNTVISLREIAEEKIKVKDLVESAVYKLRKHVEQVDDASEDDEEIGDDFENLYKGEISKSGVPILPSKRARKIPEKIQVSKEDLAELKSAPEEQSIESGTSEESISALAVSDSSAKSSLDTCIFSGIFLALFDGKIGVPLFEISPLYKFSKSSPISSSSSAVSSTCSTCFLSL